MSFKKEVLYCLFFIIVIIFFSCTKNNQKLTFIERFQLEVKGIPDFIKIPPVLTNTDKLIITQNYLIAINITTTNDSIFNVFQIPKGNYLGKFGAMGKGPNDFLRPLTNTLGSNASGIYIIDNMVFKNIQIDYSNNTLNYKVNKTPLPGKLLVINGLMSSNDSFIIGHTSNSFIQKEFFCYNIYNRSITQFSDYPNFFESSKIRKKSLYPLYLKKITSKPDGSKFAVLYSNFKRLRIYNSKNQLAKDIAFKDTPVQKFEISDDGSINTSASYSFYLDMCATDKYIYGLYLGKMQNEITLDPEIYTDTQIHIWDWNGKPIAIVKLKYTEFRIAVDGNDEYFYTINPYHEDLIYKYNLKKLLNQTSK